MAEEVGLEAFQTERKTSDFLIQPPNECTRCGTTEVGLVSFPVTGKLTIEWLCRGCRK